MKGVEIYIDDELLETDYTTSAAISHEIANIEEPNKSLTGNAKDIEIPYTARNRKILHYSEQILSRELFNNSEHTASIYMNGSLVMSGTAHIDKYVDNGNNSGHYALKILGASADWVKRANTGLIKELSDPFSVQYYLGPVYENSILTSRTLIKFFPVDRGTFYEEKNGVLVDRTFVDITDYHPFINIWLLLTLILEGYTVKSSMESFFSRLYMSGFVPEQKDSQGIEEDNNFKAASSFSPDVVAATFNSDSNSFKVNLFDRWWSTDYDLFVATVGILKTVGGFTAFAPTNACTVSFRMTISYSTTVGDNNEYVDTLKFGAGANVQELHVTPYMSKEYDAGGFGEYVPREYDTDSYIKSRYMWFLKLKHPSDYVKIIIRENVHIPGSRKGRTRDIILTENIKPDGQWLRVFVGEGRVTVKNVDYYVVDALGNERLILPGVFEQSDIVPIPDGILTFEDLEFNTYSFGVGDGQTFSMQFEFGISKGLSINSTVELCINGSSSSDDGTTTYGCTVAPDFRNAFALGSNIGISVVGGDKTQLQFIQALRQLFNLCFYTNPITKEVFIEPRTSFYQPISNRDFIIDWSDRIDYTHEVENEQVGNNIGDSFRLSYAAGNDVLKKYNRRNRRSLGTFETPLENKTTSGCKELTNPLFAPFIRREVKGMGWTVLQNVPDTEKSVVSDAEFDLTTTIGIFASVASRTTGTDLNLVSRYPVLLFQEGIHNLGFEDSRIGATVVKGLHQYYDSNIKQYNRARRITAYLRLSAIDMEKIQCPSRINADFRSVFALTHKGETLYLELEKIADFNPSSGEPTKCSFITKVED